MTDCGKSCHCISYREHLLSVAISSTAMPSRNGVAAQVQRERTLDRDLSAYKRLADDGVQPKGITGAADIEARCASKFEAESGMVLPPSVAREVEATAKCL